MLAHLVWEGLLHNKVQSIPHLDSACMLKPINPLIHNCLYFTEWWQCLRWLTRLEPSFLTTSASNQSVTDLLRSLLFTPHLKVICQGPLEDPIILYCCFLGLQPVKASKHSLHKGTSKAWQMRNILVLVSKTQCWWSSWTHIAKMDEDV